MSTSQFPVIHQLVPTVVGPPEQEGRAGARRVHRRQIVDDDASMVSGQSMHRDIQVEAVCQNWGILHRLLPVGTPHAGGFYETRHRILAETVRRCLAQYPLARWNSLLSVAQARINAQSIDRPSPHSLIFGSDFVFPSNLPVLNSVAARADEDVQFDPFLASAAEAESRDRAKQRDEFLLLWDQIFEQRQTEASRRFIVSGAPPLQAGQVVYLRSEQIMRKTATPSRPLRLLEALGRHTWLAEDLDNESIIRVHARNLYNPMDKSAVTETQGESNEDQPMVDSPPTGSSHANAMSSIEKKNLPPEQIRRVRTDGEQTFLASIAGGKSARGRIRRGRMIRNPTT